MVYKYGSNSFIELILIAGIYCLLCARLSAKHSRICHCIYYSSEPHEVGTIRGSFQMKKLRPREVHDLPKVTQLVS